MERAVSPESLTVFDIPRIGSAPAIESFLNMRPEGELAQSMARVDRFIDIEPSDGAVPEQRTEVYSGYDGRNLYFVWLCFDKEPGKIRARMTRRENIDGEDLVRVYLDTFRDRRRAYTFDSNALGVQRDAIWSEPDDIDFSFDTVWVSKAQMTAGGYVVYMAIPFESLRFSGEDAQKWGIVLQRNIPRYSEVQFWPRVTSKVQGRLSQEANLSGMKEISPGRGMQFVPYVVAGAQRVLDTRNPEPAFDTRRLGGRVGLDSKFVIHDSLVLDATLRPDFSQVESDDPQITTNQRYEVYFPEKRPFFLENSDFFATPLQLVFTRRVQDPDYGVRLTGKLGSYSLGAFAANDKGQGRSLADDDENYGKMARALVLRLNRELTEGSSVGVLYTERDFAGGYNRVGGVDARWKMNSNWTTSAQAVTSATRSPDGRTTGGPAFALVTEGNGRKYSVLHQYKSAAPGFATQLGFVPRIDDRMWHYDVHYRWRPEGKVLIDWGPHTWFERHWDNTGLGLEGAEGVELVVDLRKQLSASVWFNNMQVRLRPEDNEALAAIGRTRHYTGLGERGIWVNNSTFRGLSLNMDYRWIDAVNFSPIEGTEPFAGSGSMANVTLGLRPMRKLQVDNTYLLYRLAQPASGENIFNNHTIRTKWNYQFNRQLALRTIVGYNTTIANPAFTSMKNTKALNTDILLSYMVHPGTAFYVGYNTNLQNLDPGLRRDPAGEVLRAGNQFMNDGRQFFVKVSYLFR